MSLPFGKARWGLILVLLGVAAWIPYGILKYGMGQEIVVYPFLAVHLLGVIPGFLLRRGTLLRRLILRQRSISAGRSSSLIQGQIWDVTVDRSQSNE